MAQTAQLLTAVPLTNKQLAKPYLESFGEVTSHFEIDTPLRQAHFLAQIAHESSWFRYNKENLNYRYDRLLVIFKKYFKTEEIAQRYARKPEMIANRVYANRMNNGDEASGDGWKYRGRGLIQLTGKANYQEYSKDRGIDFVGNPDQVAEPKWALDSAAWFWTKRSLNQYADKDDVLTITKRINGGTNGLADRKKCLQLFKNALNII